MWDLFPWPGIEPEPPALGAQSPIHCASRKVPLSGFYIAGWEGGGVMRKRYCAHWQNLQRISSSVTPGRGWSGSLWCEGLFTCMLGILRIHINRVKEAGHQLTKWRWTQRGGQGGGEVSGLPRNGLQKPQVSEEAQVNFKNALYLPESHWLLSLSLGSGQDKPSCCWSL